jgi:hypothetical protein
MLDVTQTPTLPNAPGVGYKSQHFSGPHRPIPAPSAGSRSTPRTTWATAAVRWRNCALAERFPVSVHGVGLSIGGERPLDRDHLAACAT